MARDSIRKGKSSPDRQNRHSRESGDLAIEVIGDRDRVMCDRRSHDRTIADCRSPDHTIARSPIRSDRQITRSRDHPIRWDRRFFRYH